MEKGTSKGAAMMLKGKVAIITGGAQGIGAAIARKFALEGALGIIGDRIVSKECKGMQFCIHELDVTDQASVSHFVSTAHKVFGRIDILVNNAGISRDAKLLDMSMEDFDAVLDVNLRGVVRMTKAVLPHMVAQRSGVILNASSVVGKGNYSQTAYAISKAGVNAATRTWAQEYARDGIRVNAVAPGFTDTPMTSPLMQKAKDRIIATTPMRRFGTPEEIAYLYSVLASDEASFITGQIFGADGGIVI